MVNILKNKKENIGTTNKKALHIKWCIGLPKLASFMTTRVADTGRQRRQCRRTYRSKVFHHLQHVYSYKTKKISTL